MTGSVDERSLSIARRFAVALDNDDFDNATELLAVDCTYHIRDEIHRGAGEIIASYRQATEWAHETFDDIEYESEVEPLDGHRFVILFLDRLCHCGQSLDHRCRQILTIDDRAKIIDILHEDLPGESERVEVFFESVGISPRQ